MNLVGERMKKVCHLSNEMHCNQMFAGNSIATVIKQMIDQHLDSSAENNILLVNVTKSSQVSR